MLQPPREVPNRTLFYCINLFTITLLTHKNRSILEGEEAELEPGEKDKTNVVHTRMSLSAASIPRGQRKWDGGLKRH